MCPIDYHHFGQRFKQHYACFGCRKAFKAGDEFVRVKAPSPREAWLAQVPRMVACPDCGAVMARMGRQFRAPKRSKVKAWAALAARYGGRTPRLLPPFDEPWGRPDWHSHAWRARTSGDRSARQR